jgi:hypothetical protein
MIPHMVSLHYIDAVVSLPQLKCRLHASTPAGHGYSRCPADPEYSSRGQEINEYVRTHCQLVLHSLQCSRSLLSESQTVPQYSGSCLETLSPASQEKRYSFVGDTVKSGGLTDLVDTVSIIFKGAEYSLKTSIHVESSGF